MDSCRKYVLASLKALVAAVLLEAAAFTLYLYIGGFDDVAGLSLDDANLIVELDDVPDDENAFLTFMFATNYWTPVLSRFVFSVGGWQTAFAAADLV